MGRESRPGQVMGSPAFLDVSMAFLFQQNLIPASAPGSASQPHSGRAFLCQPFIGRDWIAFSIYLLTTQQANQAIGLMMPTVWWFMNPTGSFKLLLTSYFSDGRKDTTIKAGPGAWMG